MSMTFNMVGGGGSGIPGNRAVLVARIPSGSTVTATKGGVTLTPMMWVSETYPDQDIALFVFTPAQFDSVNPWIITATDGTSTASKTVIIDSNKEYEVELTYTLFYYKDGNLETAVTGGWDGYASNTAFRSDRIEIDTTSGPIRTNATTINKVSLANVSAIKFLLTCSTSWATGYPKIGVSTSSRHPDSSESGGWTASTTLTKCTDPTEFVVDVSSIMADAYISFGSYRGNAGGSLINVYRIWAVKL